ncbi:MAG: hypothetical protein ABI981_00400 [Betaproteobacteria bacterium]
MKHGNPADGEREATSLQPGPLRNAGKLTGNPPGKASKCAASETASLQSRDAGGQPWQRRGVRSTRPNANVIEGARQRTKIEPN